MAPRQSGLGDRGRAQVRRNFDEVGRKPDFAYDTAIRRPEYDPYNPTPGVNSPGIFSPDELDEVLGRVRGYTKHGVDLDTAIDFSLRELGAPMQPGVTPELMRAAVIEKMSDAELAASYPPDWRKGPGAPRPEPTSPRGGGPRGLADARAAADPAIQSDAEAARIRARVLRLRDAPEADLIPGQTADDAARLADRARSAEAAKFGRPAPASTESWADRVINQSGKPVPESAPPLPRPTSATSPLAQRAQDATSGASLSAPGQFDSPEAIDAEMSPRTAGAVDRATTPRTPAAQARAAGTTYEGPGTPPPYRPPGTDPTKGGREAAAAARESRLRGTPEMSEAEIKSLQARSSGVRGGPVDDSVDALYERRNVPGTLRPGAMLTDEIASMGDDIQSLFRQWVIDPNLDVGKLPAAQRTALTELQARVLSLTPANSSVAEFTDAVNAVGQRTFGGASWNPVTPRFDTMTQQQVYDLYKPNPDYNPGGAQSIRVGAENMDDVAALNQAASQRTAAASAIGKPASFAETLAGWDAGTPPAYAGTPPPYYNPGTPPPFAGTPPPFVGTPPPYAGTPPPFAGIPPAYNPATATPSPAAAAAAFDPGTPPPYFNPGTPPPYTPGPPRPVINAPAPAAGGALGGAGSGALGGAPAAPAAPGAGAGAGAGAAAGGGANLPPLPGFNPTSASGTPPTPPTPPPTTAGGRVASLFGGGGGLKGNIGTTLKNFGVPLAVGAAATAGGHALGDRLLEGQRDDAGWGRADWGQLASGVGDAAMPMAGLAPIAAAAMGAGPVGWTALGIGALGAGAWGLGKALLTDDTSLDRKDSLLADPTLAPEDRDFFSGAYDRAKAGGATDEQALASVSQQMDQYAQAERDRRIQEAEQMRYQVTPSQLMTLQTLQMKDMNDLTDQQRLANAAYMSEAQRFAGQPGTNPNIANLALLNANMFSSHAANQAIAYRQAYQMAPLRAMFQSQLDQANRINNSVSSRTASAYAQQLAGLSQQGQSGQPDLASLLGGQQQAPAYG